jgi:magnesium transporter
MSEQCPLPSNAGDQRNHNGTLHAVRKRSHKTGLPPGSLVYVGKHETCQSKLTVIDYDETQFTERTVDHVEDLFPYKDTATVSWISIVGLGDHHVMAQIGEHFGLHPLTLEDILNTEQRPKIEVFDDYLFVVLKMVACDNVSGSIKTENISLIVGENFVLMFDEKEGDCFDPLRERIRSNKSRIRKFGADYLAYALIDTIVDNYFLVLERLGDKIEELETDLVATPTTQMLHAAQDVRRESIQLRKAVWPLREVIASLERRESPLIKESTSIYLRDVYDHIIQVMDSVETDRDMLSEMFDLYLSSISQKTNEVMKVLTIISTIFIPLTFIAGVYGMNFEAMPELKSPLGYPAVLLFMALVMIGMVLYFRKRGWI